MTSSGCENLTETNTNSCTITNTHTPAKISIPVTKHWDDDSDRDQIRPTEVIFQLVQDDEEVSGMTLRLTADNEQTDDNYWYGSFTDLYKYKNVDGVPTEISYAVLEKQDDNLKVTGNDVTGYKADISGTQAAGFVVTNTHTPETRILTITKTWDDEGHTEHRDVETLLKALLFEIDNNLYRFADLNYVSSTNSFTAVLNGTEVIGTVGMSEDTWTVTINNLPKYKLDTGTKKEIVYKVSETLDDAYYYVEAGSSNSMKSGFTFTNHWNRTERTVCKTWNDAGHESERGNVVIHLHGSDGSVLYHTFTDKTNNMCHTFENLPVYTSSGAEIEYTTHEETVTNYVEIPAVYNEDTKTFTIENVYNEGHTLIRVTKVWDDGDNRDNVRPTSLTFNVFKQTDGNWEKYDTFVLSDGAAYGTYGPVDITDPATGKTITWTVEEVVPDGYSQPAGYDPHLATYSWTFKNHRDIETVDIQMTKTWDDNDNLYDMRDDQPLKLLRRLKLIDKTNASSTVEYSLFGLTPDAGNPSIDATKQTVSSYPVVYNYTASVDGNPVTVTVSVTNLNTWTVNISGVPKNKGGNPITWSVNENPDAYEFTVNSAAASGGVDFAFTGDNFLNLTRGTIRKVWEDASAPSDPDAFMEGVKLYYNTATQSNVYYYHGTFTRTGSGTEDSKPYWTYSISAHPDVVVTIVENSKSNWTVTVDKMPRKINGELVTGWTVTEELDGYTSVVNGLTVTNVPEIEVKVKKVWNDSNNQDGYRKDVTLNLLWNNTASGTEEILESVTVPASSGDSWEYTFSGLQKYKDDSLTDAITYTVTETLPTEMAGYYTPSIAEPTGTEEAWVVTNTHEIDTINFKICKVWDDNEDQDGLRSTAAAGKNMRLLADGEVVTSGEFAVPTEDGCTTFMGLPKFQAGSHGGVIHYTAEEDTITGYTASFAEEDVTEADDPMGEDPTLIEYHKFEFTNTHTPETINVIVNKNWDDNNNQDGMRSKVTATIQLYKQPEGGSKTAVSGQTAEVGTENNWGHEFKNLPKYENGKEITYTVEETIVLRDTSLTTIPYTASYSGNMSDGLVVTNTHTTETIDLTMTKVWNDQNDQDGLRQLVSDTGLVFYLYQGVTVYRTTSCTSTDDTWTYTFEDLPKYCGSGALCVYTISEPQPLTGYTPSYNQSILTVTNNHTPETVTVQGSKTWADNDNRAGKRPGTIYIQLWKDNAPYTGVSDFRKAITAATEEIAGTAWSWKWEGLPKYENGKEIEWSVFEENVSEYQTTYPSGYNVTNTYNEGTTSVSVKKVWIDEDNRDGIRPTYIYVDLYADGVKTTQSKALADANNWLNTFTDLPIYRTGQAGQEIDYTVKEANAVTGYTILDPVYDDATNVWTITNTHEPITTSVEGHKTWVNRDLDDNAPSSITVHLYADGVIVAGKDKTITEASVEDGTNAWSWKWENLPKYKEGEVGKEIVYTVRETPITGYIPEVVSPNVTNTYSPGKTSLSVRKAWNDNYDQDGLRPGHVEVALLSRVGNSGTYTATGQTAVLVPDTTSSNLWRVHTFTDLDRYTSAGQPIYYSVKEIGTIPGYEISDPVLDPASGVYVITNTHTPETITITGEKVWDNANDPTKPESVTVHLLANGIEVSEKTITVNKDTAQVDDKAWTWKWEDLPKYANGREITYTVSEKTLDDYTLSVRRTPSQDGKSISFVLTNTYDPGMITVRVQKVWEDNNNQDRIRPESVEVKLIADGDTENPVATAILPQEGTWRARFNVPEYRDVENKIKYVYTVQETFTDVLTGVDGAGTYAQNITGDVENGFVITNIHTPETVYIHGDKKWVGDYDAPAGTRPESVTFVLKRNNETIAYTVAHAADNWEWEFPLQPRYVNGVDMSNAYEVTELNVPNYETVIDGWIDTNEQDYTNGVTNIYTPGKTSVSVTKVWRDNDNQDGIRPARVAVQLVADGTPVPERYLVLQGTGNSWIGTFNDLDIYPYGSTTPIVYTVQEVGTYAGYTMQKTGDMATGFTITNSHRPETTEVSGTKTWDDNNNQDGKRPTSIKINLLKNGSTYESKTVTEADGWAWSWTNLPKYENGSLINWTITEDSITDYTQAVSGYNVTNSYTPGKTSIRVNKVWSDGDNQDGMRPANIVVFLKANGETIDTAVLNQSNSWSYQFRNLDRNKDGQPIVYTVEELHTEIITGTDGAGTYKDVVAGTAEGVFTITNTHTPETVTVSGSKEWANVPAGVSLPESITIHLYANNAELTDKVKTVTAADGWNWSWEGLPKYSNGREISYTVSEDQVEEYTRVVEKTGNSFKVTNTYNPGNVTIVVRKEWKDNNNQDGIRPPWVLVNLLGDGEVVDSAVLGSSNEWRHRFTVPAYDGTRKITYTTEEVYDQVVTAGTDGPGTYAMTGITETSSGFIIENTHTPEKVSVEGAKTWDDNDNQDGKRPTSITIRLYKNNTEYDHKTVSAATTAYEGKAWSWSWTNLPKNENGQPISWTIREDDITDYSKSVNGYDVTNSYTPGKTVVAASKVWTDGNNQDGIRPDYAEVTLYADGVSTGKKGVLIASNNWTYRFTDLDINKDGKKIIYTVVEENVPAGYTVSYSGDAATSLTVTNTHEPEKVKIVVTKTWDDAGNETNRPGEVNLYLHADGEQIQYKQFTSAETAAAGWKWEIDNLPKYKNGGTEITYTIRENTYEEYTRSVSRSVTPATGTEKEQLNLAVTNKWTPGTTSIAVQKIWTDGNNQDGIRPTWVLINLKDEAGNVVASERVTAPTWLVRFENIDEYDASGKLINYSVEEVFDRTVTEKTDGPGTYKLVEIKSVDDGFTIENAHTPEKVTVSGVKTWDDNNNQDDKRPTSIKINLLKNGSAYESKTVTEADGWAWSWTGLPKYENGSLINWTITEDSITDYTQAVSGYNVTNSYTPGKTSIRVNKVWSDGDNQDGMRPANIVVFLKANGETIDTAVLNQSNSWSYQFRNLDRNKDGQPIVYTVEELHTEIITGTDGAGTYKDVVAGTAEGVFTITNTHTPETVTVSGSKEWANVPAGVSLPESITIHLYANNAELTDKVKTVTAADGWNWSWEGLPKYSNGREISYTVSEDQVEEYTRVVEKTGNSFKVTNTYNPGNVTIVVRKEWKDNNNQDGIRPPWVLVNLLGDGEVVDSAVLGSSNEWRHRFTVPAYDGTRKITYTTEEVYDQVVTAGTDGPGTYAMTGITETSSGFIIENTHTPEKVSVEGAKTWDDNDNQDGKRPTSITIRLYKNNTEYDHKTVSAATTAYEGKAWSWSWTNLPKNENGQPISWTIREDDITDYSKSVNGYDVTNSYTPGKTVVAASKVWTDGNNQDGIRPDYAEVTLYADGVSTGKKGVLIASNNWTYRFTDLDINKDGKKIIYTVVEENVPAGYTVSYSGDAATSLTVTNTHEPEKVKIVVTKTWDDAGNETNRPGEVNLYLHADGEQIQYKQFTSAETAAAGWKWEIDNLPKYKNGGTEITYTIRENTYEEYTRSVSRSVTPATGTEKEQLNLAVTNKWTPGTTSIAVQKIWTDGNNQDGIRPTWVLINLKDEAGNVVASERVTAPTWLVRFENIDEYDASGKLINYSVEEVFDRTVTEKTDGPGTYKLVEIKSVDDGFTIENAHTPEKVTVSGVKTWDDNNNQDGKRPTSITIRLLKNNVEYASKTVRESDEWKWEWTGLPKYENGKLINWSITEDDIPDYTKSVSGYNVTNSYTPGKTAVRVNKVWRDEENQDGLRQLNVGVYLLADGEIIDSEVLNAANGWTYLFSNLDRTKNGNTITYTVEEVHSDFITGVDGPGTYQDVVTGDAEHGFTITNVHTPEMITLSGSKTWVGRGLDPNAPTELKVHLFSNGTEIASQAKTVTEADGWKWEWTKLPKYAKGKEITYTMSEETDYTKRVERVGNTFNVTNTYDPDNITILILKDWEDQNNQDGIRPPWTMVYLKANGKTVATEFLNDANNWRVRVDVPEYDENHQKIEYTVEEVFTRTVTKDTDGPGTYALESIKGNAADGFTITNRHTPENVSVSGTKTWDDDNNRDGKRPTSITINLLKNGTQYDSKTVTEENGWAYSWPNLPKYENGTLITWTVTETPVEGYARSWNGYNVTNTYNPDKVDVTVVKSWSDGNNQDGLRPDYARVYLYADGVKTDQFGILIGPDWMYRFTGLDKYKNGQKITYTVREESSDVPAGYSVSYAGDMDSRITVTNTHIPETVKIVVTKTWDDAGNESNRPETVNLYLLSDGEQIRSAQFSTAETAAEGWKWEIDNLPKYKGAGTAIQYTLVESAYGDYTRSVTRSTTDKTETSPEQLNLAVTNKWNQGKTSIVVEKEWTDNNNQDGIRPSWVLVNLLDSDNRVVASGRLTEANNWILRFENLDAGQDYHVEEVYDRTVTESTDGPGTYRLIGIKEIAGGYEIENGHTPETIDVSGFKTWNDNNDQDGKRPDSITIRLLKNNSEYDQKTVTADDGWKWEWKNLPKFDGGRLISWTVNEDDVTDYTKSVSGYNVTNSYTPGKTAVRVNKVWDDKENQDGLRQINVTVFLKANGEIVSTGVFNEASNWSYLFSNLDRNKNGKPIEYTVEELHTAFITGTDGPGTYADVVTGTAETGFTITNIHTPETVTVSGSKEWANVPAGVTLPESITLHLYADNVELTDKVKTVTAESNWTWSWEGLPKYANGKEISYTISEDQVDGYTRVVEKVGNIFKVINTYNPGNITIIVRKEWKDNNNQDGIRPAFVQVNLLDGNGRVVDSAVLDSGNEWRHRFTDLPEYSGAGKINYTVEEVFDSVVTEDTDGAGTYALTEITGSASGGFIIENTHTPETVTVEGSKEWDDKDNQDGKRPETITIRLYKNNTEYDHRVITQADDGRWSWRWSGLPKYENGSLINWSIREDDIADYSKTVSGYNVTNSYTPGKTVVAAAKVWADNEDQDGLRQNMAEVTLYADGVSTGKKCVLNAANDWTCRFTDLDINKAGVKINYTIVEENVPEGYEAVYSGDAATGLTVTNTHLPEMVKIVVTKTWDDAGNEANRPGTVNLYLLSDGETIQAQQFSSAETAEPSWKWEIDNLPKFKDHGTAIHYTIVEDAYSEYSRSVTRSVTPAAADQSEQLNLAVTNKWTPGKTTIMVEKEWTDDNNRDGIRPASITVNLLDGSGRVVGTGALSEENNWIMRFEVDEYDSDRKPITYRVAEVFEGVLTESTDGPGTYRLLEIREIAGGFEIENLHTPETVTVAGSKTWKDNDNLLGMRPDKITIKLLADNEQVDFRVVTEKNGWHWSFTGLPKYDKGVEITYTIEEERVENYTPAVNGYDVVNTSKPGYTSLNVLKVWDDNHDEDGLRPESVTVRLLANDVEKGTIVLSERNQWSYLFTDLPIADAAGKIQYTVEETNVPDVYGSVVSGDMEHGYVITNTYVPIPPDTITIPVRKQWSGVGEKPASVTIHLLADGQETGETLVLTAREGWIGSFVDLPMHDAATGVEIVYSIKESPVPEGYDCSVSGSAAEGFTVTNTKQDVPPVPPVPPFFPIEGELPKTGITNASASRSLNRLMSVSYQPMSMDLLIPGLNVESSIVMIEPVDGVYPVELLGNDSGLLAGTARPGEGLSVIAAHNTLDADEYGPFALIGTLEKGDRFFVRNEEGELMIFEVYTNEKIGSHDGAALYQAASQYSNTITLLTCEDERPEGGYASRRIVTARMISAN